MAIELNNVTSGYNISTINANFQKLEDALNGSLVWRNGSTAGETLMGRDLDMNGNLILNVRTDTSNPSSLLTVGQGDSRYYNVSGDSLEGPLNANGNQLLGIPSPSQGDSAVNKSYTDSADTALSDRITSLSSSVSGNNSRTLRFPDVVAEMPDVVTRANSLQGYNAQGKPVPIFSTTNTADLALQLASATGGRLVGLVQGGTVQDALDKVVSVKAFGAKGDFNPTTKTGTDDTTAFKNAVAFAVNNGYRNVYIPAGHYLLTDEINIGGASFTSGEGERDYWRGITKGVNLYGDGPYSTILVFNPPSLDTPCLSARGGWGTHSPRAISNLAIEPLNWADYNVSTTGTGILLQGCCFVPVTDVHIGRFHRGIHLWNLLQGPSDTSNTFTSGDFTEFNRFTRVRVFNSDISADYQVTKGNNSFHGNTWDDCMFQIKLYGGVGINCRDDGTRDTVTTPSNPWYQFIANVYNNRFDINLFGSDTQTCYAISLSKAQVVGASGDLTVEGGVTLKTATFEWMQSFGSFTSISGISTDVGTTDTATRPVAFIFQNASYPQRTFDGVEPLLPATLTPRAYDGNNYGNTGMDLLNIRGAQTGSIWSQQQSSVSLGWLFTYRSQSGTRPGQRVTWQFSYDGTKINSPKATSIGLYNLTTGVNLTASSFAATTTGISNGTSSIPWTNLYLTDWSLGSGGIVPSLNNTSNIGSSTLLVRRSYTIARYFSATVFDSIGTGSPEGTVAASIGSTYRRSDGGTGTSFYVKEAGTGNTGWVAK